MDDLIAFLTARLDELEREVSEDPIATSEQAYILADIAAKQRIITEVVPKVDALDDTLEGEYGAGAPIGLHEESALLLRLLAAPFARHRDYRQEWTP